MKRKTSANAARSVSHQADFKVRRTTWARGPLARVGTAEQRLVAADAQRSARRRAHFRLSLRMCVHTENQAESRQEGAHQGERHKHKLRYQESVEQAKRRSSSGRRRSERPTRCSLSLCCTALLHCCVVPVFLPPAIHVPTQKLHVDNTAVSADAAAEASALTNARHLNLHDLFGQIKHYNVNVRRG